MGNKEQRTKNQEQFWCVEWKTLNAELLNAER